MRWKACESLELAADSTFFLGRLHCRRVSGPFTPKLPVAVTQVLAGDADAVEVLVTPDNVKRVQADSALATYPYKGGAYGYLGFNLAAPGDSTQDHPLFGERDLRRALVMAVAPEPLLPTPVADPPQGPPRPLPPLWGISAPPPPHSPPPRPRA